MRTIPTIKSMAIGIIVAAGAVPRVRRQCAWPRVRSLRSISKQTAGIEIYGYVSQLGSIAAERFVKTEIESNPFFFPDPDKVPELEILHAGSAQGRELDWRQGDGGC